MSSDYVCHVCGAQFAMYENILRHIIKNHPTAEYVKTKPEREATRPRYDLIPKLFLDELASIFEEGIAKYGENSWKSKSPAFFRDCLNHAMDHLLRHNAGDTSENQLSKVAWNVLAYKWAEKEGLLVEKGKNDKL